MTENLSKGDFAVLPVEFDGTGEQSHARFTQLLRDGNVAVYEKRSQHSGLVFAYEIVTIKRQKPQIMERNGVSFELKDKELYPSTSQFGISAFMAYSRPQAEEIFEDLVARERNRELGVRNTYRKA